MLQTVRYLYGEFGKVNVVSGSGTVFRKTLLFSFVVMVGQERKKCWTMKYAELKNEYHRQITHKNGPKNMNIVNIAGILWRCGNNT